MPSTVPGRPDRVLVNFSRPRVRKKVTRTRLRDGLHTEDTVRTYGPSSFASVQPADAHAVEGEPPNTREQPPQGVPCGSATPYELPCPCSHPSRSSRARAAAMTTAARAPLTLR